MRYGLARAGRVLIGDQMGLGKTLQALALIACYEEDWPCLILVGPGRICFFCCPNSL